MNEIFIKITVASLNAFAKMLGLNPLDESDNHEEMHDLRIRIQQDLDSGAIALQEIDGFTPLMLYCAFNIFDDRFHSQIAKGSICIQSYTSMTIDDFDDFSPGTAKINALTYAVTARNMRIAELLLSTGLFFEPEDYRLALSLATINDFPEFIKLFAEYQLNLFIPILSGQTALTCATQWSYIDVINEILKTNPDDLILKNSSMLAIEIASSSINTAVQEEFEHLALYQQKKLTQAIMNNQINQCIAILNKNHGFNFLLSEYNNRYYSLLLLCYDSNVRDEITNVLKDYLKTLPFNDQINTLILIINELENIAPQFIPEYLVQLNELTNENLQQITSLILPNSFEQPFEEELWTIINTILCNSPLETIDISLWNTNSNDFFPILGEINLNPKIASRFILNLLNNTTLIKCELYLPDIYDSLVDIVQLIIDRNLKIKEMKTNLSKDNAFNQFALEINELIDDFQNHFLISSQEKIFSHIQPKKEVYSLVEYASLTLWHNKESWDSESLPKECNDTIMDIGNSFNM